MKDREEKEKKKERGVKTGKGGERRSEGKDQENAKYKGQKAVNHSEKTIHTI